jgi:hypothetical protein
MVAMSLEDYRARKFVHDVDIKLMEACGEAMNTDPYAYAIYQSTKFSDKVLPFEFRSFNVNSYLIFYYVTENIVTTARVEVGGRGMRNVL